MLPAWRRIDETYTPFLGSGPWPARKARVTCIRKAGVTRILRMTGKYRSCQMVVVRRESCTIYWAQGTDKDEDGGRKLEAITALAEYG